MANPKRLELQERTLDNLIAIREQITRSPKPTYDIDGQEVKWTEYLDAVTKQITVLLAESDDEIVEVHTQAYL
jgi:hypothetical protein